MTINEYNKVKDFTYLEYCDYLQNKYGKSQYDYMTKSWSNNPKTTRTKEGLFAHHKYEDHDGALCLKEQAMRHPFEWQKAENIIYCDYLEHLLLHILICEYPAKNAVSGVGIGGAIYFIIPDLNDLYSGMPITLPWKENCFNKVKDDINCYMTLVKRLVTNSGRLFDEDEIFSSAGESFGTWSADKNEKLTEQLEQFIKE